MVSGHKSGPNTPVSENLKESLMAQPSEAIMISSVSRKMKKEVFLCPMVPVLPLVAAWVDILMMASLGIPALGGLIIMLICGLFIYFSYGIYNSKLRQ
jgi:hypothetical protein